MNLKGGGVVGGTLYLLLELFSGSPKTLLSPTPRGGGGGWGSSLPLPRDHKAAGYLLGK